jgi:hypothetical protein
MARMRGAGRSRLGEVVSGSVTEASLSRQAENRWAEYSERTSKKQRLDLAREVPRKLTFFESI